MKFGYIGNGTKNVVFTPVLVVPEPPHTVVFRWEGFTGVPAGDIVIVTRSFQQLRRGVAKNLSDNENKIELIKAVRGLLGVGLKQAKDITEFFLDNFEFYAD